MTLREWREWNLLWFGVIPKKVWDSWDSDRIADQRSLRAPKQVIWGGPIGDLSALNAEAFQKEDVVKRKSPS